MKIMTVSLAIFITGLLVSPLYADIYSWTDEKGVKHFSNVPPANAENVERFYILIDGLMRHYQTVHFDLTFFKEVALRMVPINKAKFLFAKKDKEIISGILLLTHGKVIEYLE